MLIMFLYVSMYVVKRIGVDAKSGNLPELGQRSTGCKITQK